MLCGSSPPLLTMLSDGRPENRIAHGTERNLHLRTPDEIKAAPHCRFPTQSDRTTSHRNCLSTYSLGFHQLDAVMMKLFAVIALLSAAAQIYAAEDDPPWDYNGKRVRSV